MCSLKLCHAWIHTYRLGELQMGPSKYIQSHFDYYPGLPPPLREANQHIFTLHFCLCFERSGKLWPRKRPWRAPPGPKVHLSLQHTGQTASLKYTHLPMFIHCRPLESKYNVECKGLKPPIFHQLTKSPTVGSFFFSLILSVEHTQKRVSPGRISLKSHKRTHHALSELGHYCLSQQMLGELHKGPSMM